MELIHTENAGDNFIIEVYTHDPDIKKPKTKKQIDSHDIWSVDQALTLAYQDIPEYEHIKEQD